MASLRNKKQSQEDKGTIPAVPEGWDRCHAYLEQKRRFCRQHPIEPSSAAGAGAGAGYTTTPRYCGNHRHLLFQSSNDSPSTNIRKRIPCPIDPSHLIYEDMVDKHITICPRVKRQRAEQEQVYYRQNINAGGEGSLGNYNDQNDTKKNDIEWAKRVAVRVLEVFPQIFSQNNNNQRDDGDDNYNDDKQKKLISSSSTCKALQQIHDAIPIRDLSQHELDKGFVESIEHYRCKSGGPRHVQQQASLIGHLRRIGVIPTTKVKNNKDESLLLLEMGAGRGMFGLTAAGVSSAMGVNVHLVMVERAGTRGKAETILRNIPSNNNNDKKNKVNETNNDNITDASKMNKASIEKSSVSYMKLENVSWSRMVCDLAHVHLPEVLKQQQQQVRQQQNHSADKIAIIAKHLCGVGTDFALKSLYPIKSRLSACVMATCCHGICCWKDYVGREYLTKIMSTKDFEFGSDEFALLCKWSAGTVATTEAASKNNIETKQSCCVTTKGRNSVKDLSVVDGNKQQDEQEEPIEHSHELLNKQNERGVVHGISTIVDALSIACGVNGLGRACQRLIDYGRLQYLKDVILFNNPDNDNNNNDDNNNISHQRSNVELFCYVSPDVTPQNAVLIANRSSPR